MSTLAAIQQDIARLDHSAEAYYTKSYAPVEARYWTHIAGWMVEDGIERDYIRHEPVSRVLDVGCGYGTLLAFATLTYGAPGTCVDVVQYLQPEFMQRYNLRFVSGNVELDPLPGPSQFDIAIMTEVLEHLNFQPVPTLRKILASLKDGGALFLSTPDADEGWGRVQKYYKTFADIPPVDATAPRIDDHVWQYNRTELETALQEAGFVIRNIELSDGPQGKHFNVWAVKPARPAREP